MLVEHTDLKGQGVQGIYHSVPKKHPTTYVLHLYFLNFSLTCNFSYSSINNCNRVNISCIHAFMHACVHMYILTPYVIHNRLKDILLPLA